MVITAQNFGAAKPSSVLTRVQQASLLVIGAWALSPALAYSTYARGLAAFALVTWLVTEFVRFPNLRTLATPETSVSGVLAIYLLVTNYLAGSASPLSPLLQLLVALAFLPIAGAYRKRGWKDVSWLLWVFFAIIAYYSLLTGAALAADARAARIAVRATAAARELGEAGVGGYGFVYACVFAAIAAVGIALRPDERLRARLAAAAMALVAGYIVLTAGYTIALFILASSLLLLTLAHYARPTLFIAAVISMVALFVVVNVFQEEVLAFLIDLAYDTPYRVKLEDLARSLLGMGVESAESISERQLRYSRSLEIILENPMGAFSYRDIGKHSQLLDLSAQYGLIAGIGLVYAFVLRTAFELRSNGMAAIHFAAGYAALVLISLNNVAYTAAFVLFIVVPMAARQASRAEGDEFVAVPSDRLSEFFEMRSESAQR